MFLYKFFNSISENFFLFFQIYLEFQKNKRNPECSAEFIESQEGGRFLKWFYTNFLS